MKIARVIVIILLTLFWQKAEATHLVGGFMSYRYLGQNGTSTQYRVKLYVYRDCSKDGTADEVPFDTKITVCVYNKANNKYLEDYVISLASESSVDPVGNTSCPELAKACLKRGIYDGTIVVPNSSSGYRLRWERCCRNTQNNLSNDNTGTPYQGQTYYAEIPASALKNSSPEFLDVPVPFICAGDTTTIRNRAVDIDGDSLTYRFVTPWQGASNSNPLPSTCVSVLPQAQNFQKVDYVSSDYYATQPFGPGGISSIDPLNGLTTYLAPFSGRYAVAIEVTEWRAGVAISSIRLDLQILVLDCKPNNKPRLSYQGGSRVWSVEAGDQICRDVSGIDDIDVNDKITVKGYGDVLTGANGFKGTKGTLSPSPATATRIATTRFCWKTDCDQASAEPYVLTFETFDNGCPSKFVNENVLIYVNPFNPLEQPVGPISVCQNAQQVVYSIANKGTTNSYKWSVEGGTISGDSTLSTVSVNWGSGNTGKVLLWITSKFGCKVGPRALTVTLNPAPARPKISGNDTVCLNSSLQFSSTAEPNVTYQWSAIGGNIVGSNTNDKVLVFWNQKGTGKVILSVTNIKGCTSPPDTFNVYVSHPNTPDISGPTSICPNNKGIVYKINPASPGSLYKWYVSGGVQSGGGMGSTVTIDWGNKGVGTIKVVEIDRIGCIGDTVYLSIDIDHGLDGQLPVGDTSICENTRGMVYQVVPVNGETYDWTVTGGTIVSGQGTWKIVVDWGSTGTGSVGVQTFAYDSINHLPCVSPVRARIVNIRPVPGPASINGTFEVCQQKNSLILTLAGFNGSSFDWQIPGLNFSGQGTGTVNVNIDTFGTFNVRVREISQYNCVGPWNDTVLLIHPKPRTTPISGTDVICVPHLTNYSYSVTGFANSVFTWWIDGGSIVSGQSKNTIVADWNGQQYSHLKVQEVSEFGCPGDTLKLDVFVDDPHIECRLVTVNPPPGDDKNILVYYNLTNAPRNTKDVIIQRRLRASTSGFETVGLTDPLGFMFTDKTGLPDSQSYEYRAVAINQCGDSVFSNQNTDVLLKGVKTGPFSYKLSFTDYLNWPGGVDRYELYRLLENKSDYQLYDVFSNPTVVTYDNGKEHYGMWFRIKAVENGGDNRESWSNDVKIYFEPVIFVPNAFSPNDNGLNDRFLPNSGGMKTYHLRIYDRWGEKLFETDNNEVGWDGTFMNKPVQEGIYVYVIDYSDYKDKTYQVKGTIHLLR